MLEWLFPTYSTCLVCGKEDESSLTTGFCAEHAADLPYAQAADCVFTYDEPIRGLVHDWKYRNKRYLSKVFAHWMQERVAEVDYDLLTFVPMTAKKKADRGYNQVELLCWELDKLHTKTLLRQVKDTPSQTELEYRQRLANRIGVYAAAVDAAIRGANILLVDDVRTTGATITECRNVLLQAGAKSVILFTLCRVQEMEER